MVAPVISVGEATKLAEIARLLTAYGIKRVPVLRQGRVAGIVSRADLVRALAEEVPERTAPQSETGGLFAEALARIERHFRHRGSPQQEARFASQIQLEPAGNAPNAGEFRRLVAEHEIQERQHQREARLVDAEERQH